jgi:hypothetical protein
MLNITFRDTLWLRTKIQNRVYAFYVIFSEATNVCNRGIETLEYKYPCVVSPFFMASDAIPSPVSLWPYP